MTAAALAWIDRNILSLSRELRVSYLPPLMVYLAAGVSGLTGIVGTFFVKEHLGLSAEFLAALGFWAGIPWALKMPLGHLVDLIWRWKSLLVWVGASLIAASIAIMIGLIAHKDSMQAWMGLESWYVLAALLAPVGYVVQDTVADAMTVEAVPRFGDDGRPVDETERKLMHVTMQTLGRVAIIGGTVLVAVANVYLFTGADRLPEAEKTALYADIYRLALAIPLVSVSGVLLGAWVKRREAVRLGRLGLDQRTIARALRDEAPDVRANPWILGGSLLFVAVVLAVGLARLPYGQELIFCGSLAIVLFLMARLARELGPEARQVLVATAAVVFVYRAMPGPGVGATWWQIDVLGFDQAFLSKLSLIVGVLTLAGMFVFRRFMAERSIAYVLTVLTIASTLLALPTIGMYYGLHEWTKAMTGGVVDQRFIAVIDTALESPLGQIAMIPMLAWIANSAPDHLKATWFAVVASFTNLALSASQLGTKYLNQMYTVTREIRDPATGTVKVPADYGELGGLLITAAVVGCLVPLAAVAIVRALRLRTA